MFLQLSERGREVLDLVARGLDNCGIARALHLAKKTVRSHVSSVSPSSTCPTGQVRSPEADAPASASISLDLMAHWAEHSQPPTT